MIEMTMDSLTPSRAMRGAFCLLALLSLTGCPPLFVRFRPVLQSDTTVARPAAGVGSAVETSAGRLVVTRMEALGSTGPLSVVLELPQSPVGMTTVETNQVYLTGDTRRFDLYSLEYQIGAGTYVSAYRGGGGNNRLRARYDLGNETGRVSLGFESHDGPWPQDLVLHLDGLEIGGERLRSPLRYRVDCEDLQREMPSIQRWLGIGSFAYYCKR